LRTPQGFWTSLPCWARRLGALCPVLVPLFLWSCATPPSPPSDQASTSKRVTFHEISFDLPEGGWEQIGDRRAMVQVSRKYGEHQGVSVSLWPVGVPANLRALTPRQHTLGYFDGERRSPRYEGHWEGFSEAERQIAGRHYPIMTFRVRFPPRSPVTPAVDGLFLLYFPDDFQTRQRFYVLMWQDSHPVESQAIGLDELDAVVSSLRVESETR
jgi:hypothetical protein